jgi:hypothetical protein
MSGGDNVTNKAVDVFDKYLLDLFHTQSIRAAVLSLALAADLLCRSLPSFQVRTHSWDVRDWSSRKELCRWLCSFVVLVPAAKLLCRSLL